MKIFDRFILKEFLKFAFLGLAAVVAIYLLIDLFEELSYFTLRKVRPFILIVYYIYQTPEAVSLLLPVGFVLSTFFVYGRLNRQKELWALLSAGIDVYRLFTPVIITGLISIPLFILHREFIEIPSKRRLQNLRAQRIERRQSQPETKRRDFPYKSDEGREYYIKEISIEGVIKNLTIFQYDKECRIIKRIDAQKAVYQNGFWKGFDLDFRLFTSEKESLVHYDSLSLEELKEAPKDFFLEIKSIEEVGFLELYQTMLKKKRAGAEVSKERVELNYRISDAFISFIVIILALPLTTKLRRGGVMFGLGLGLLFSFIYWGLIQTFKAFGVAKVISPFLSAWIPNILFFVVALYFLFRVRR